MSMLIVSRRSLCLLAPLAVISATFGWLAAPYLQGEAEYARLRKLADSPATHRDAALPTASAHDAPPSDPLMQRTVDWSALRDINPDIIGWIYVPNTPIDYPVVQAPPDDPERYLHTTFGGAVSYPNNQGAIYLDAGNAVPGFSSEAPLIYGHQQLNGSMLSAFSENHLQGVMDEHADVYLYDPTHARHIELFAANAVDASEETVKTSFSSQQELRSWIDEKLAASEVVRYDPGPIDQLWTFCTCSYGLWQNQRTLSYGCVIDELDYMMTDELPV